LHPDDPPPLPPVAAVFGPLAASLSQSPWQEDALHGLLLTRLPGPLRAQARRVAQGLIGAFPGSVAPDAARLCKVLRDLPGARGLRAHAARTGLRPAPELTPPTFLPAPGLAGLALPVLTSPADLADFLAISPDQLIRFADLRGLSARSPDPFGPHYLCQLRPKRRGGWRLIEAPRPFLKTLQRQVLSGLLAHVPPHPAAYGFRRGRNCIMAAARHAGEPLVAGFDIADFFPRLTVARVYGLFRALGYPAAVARDLAGLCTAITPAATLAALPTRDAPIWRTRHLPQGAPTSPALANLLAWRLDCRLAGLARSLGATYTRYADDLTFSGPARIGPILRDAVPAILRGEGFAPNLAKTRLMTAHGAQIVTGVMVNRHVNLPRAEFDRLKAVLHHLARPDDPRRQDAGFLAALSGRIGWVEQINPARGAKLRARLVALTG